MAKPIIYGIKNCDTMKKTFQWFEKHNIDYDFHDYKKLGTDKAVISKAFDAFGWEEALNRKGTTWRKLPEDVREGMTKAKAMKIALENPSILKRPLIMKGDDMVLGFDEAAWAKKLGARK